MNQNDLTSASVSIRIRGHCSTELGVWCYRRPSDRMDPAYDLYVTKRGPNGWSEPQNLGPNINRRGYLEESAAFYEDEDGHTVMLFGSRRPDGSDGKIYQSVDGGPATLVAGGPHSSANDDRPSITRDGLTIFFDSDRY